ncbi:hypothetical protein TVAG_378830 [Trichomonas vaginalis G3]|uniref:Uncharacterized protein n=1 Tax=Trichomonas vaginalis (strain ATCC PRA-98 / G3) TaxID=412133 RepID=A2DB74_TRIV3|nr:hypothetical protein TVAGG3_0509140 [Trichomonas vaginalis G3]EAY22404.1 hypothetical protein TVAG_378830 [Trichomonas vaginalis G3]KAI5517652.1 hypothetical protein TVAGG3_0509140 [Trichomonas vaginalis G3]|eukprot:XP_001583390.1 hypothetical protein [Trichomonas vaginalis G3]
MTSLLDDLEELCRKISKLVYNREDTSSEEISLQLLLSAIIFDENTKFKVEEFPENLINMISSIIKSKNSGERIRRCLILILYKVYIETPDNDVAKQIFSILIDSFKISYERDAIRMSLISISKKYKDNDLYFSRFLEMVYHITNISDRNFKKIYPATNNELVLVHIDFEGGFKTININPNWGNKALTEFIASIYGVEAKNLEINLNSPDGKITDKQVITVRFKSNNAEKMRKIPIICQYRGIKKIISATSSTSIKTLINIINYSFPSPITTPCTYRVIGNNPFEITTKKTVCDLSLQKGDIIQVVDILEIQNNDEIYHSFFKLLFEAKEKEATFKKSAAIASKLLSCLQPGKIMNDEFKDVQYLISTFPSRNCTEQRYYLAIMVNVMNQDPDFCIEFCEKHGIEMLINVFLSKKLHCKELLDIVNMFYEKPYNIREFLFEIFKMKNFDFAKMMISRFGDECVCLPDEKSLMMLIKSYSPDEKTQFLNSFSEFSLQMDYFGSVMKSNGQNPAVSPFSKEIAFNEFNRLKITEDFEKYLANVTKNNSFRQFLDLIQNPGAKDKIIKNLDILILPMYLMNNPDAVKASNDVLIQLLRETTIFPVIFQKIQTFISRSTRSPNCKLRNDKCTSQSDYFLIPLLKILGDFNKKNFISDKGQCASLIDCLALYLSKHKEFDENALEIAKIIIEFPIKCVFPENFVEEEDDDDSYSYFSNSSDDDDEKDPKYNSFDLAMLPYLTPLDNYAKLVNIIRQKAKSDKEYSVYFNLISIRCIILQMLHRNPNDECINTVSSISVQDFNKILTIFKKKYGTKGDREEVLTECSYFISQCENKEHIPLIAIKLLLIYEKGDEMDQKYVDLLRNVFICCSGKALDFRIDMLPTFFQNVSKTKDLEDLMVKILPYMKPWDGFQTAYLRKNGEKVLNHIHQIIMSQDEVYKRYYAHYGISLDKIAKNSRNKEQIKPKIREIKDIISNSSTSSLLRFFKDVFETLNI